MFKGSLVALITPMHEDGSIDYQSLEKLVDFHVENKTDAIVAAGTTGESSTMDIREQLDVIAKTKEYSNGRIDVIAGTGGNSTHEAVELTQGAADIGVAGCLLVVPYYNKPTQRGLYEHFKYIAEAVDIPQILYNVPGRTALDMDNDTVVNLAKISNIIGIKNATPDIDRVIDYKNRCGTDFAVYSGNDDVTLDSIKAGGEGCISVVANVAPKLMHEMCYAALEGDLETAQQADDKLRRLHFDLFIESNPIPVKWAVSQLGYCANSLRLPLTELSDQYHQKVKEAMMLAGVL